MRSPSFGFILIFAVSAIVLLWAVGTLIYILRHRRQKQRLTHGPICGSCGYAASIGPDGFTRCPECGGDYAKVGILGAATRTGNPAILLSAGLGWVLAVSVFMVIATFALGQWLSVTINTSTVSQNGNWSSPRGGNLSIDVTTVTTTITGRARPTSDVATVDIASGLEKHVIVIDNNDGKITSSTAPALPVGSTPSDAAIQKAVADLMPDVAPTDLAAFQAEAVQVIGKRAVAPRAGMGMRSSSSTSSSIGGRGGLSSSTGTSSGTMTQSGWIGIGSMLISTAMFAFTMAAIGLIIP
ncbi:MAG: hypothetical protein ACREJO_12655, partial [Phycisphaerales bacterium]